MVRFIYPLTPAFSPMRRGSPSQRQGRVRGQLLYVLTAIFFVGFSFSSHAETKITEPQKLFNAETFTLKNGLEIVVIPNHRAPVVTHMIWYKVGAADEPPGQSGIAHFLEHLMFKGSAGLAPGEFSKRIRAMGGNDNAFTGQDYTAYFQSIPAENLETVMRMEAGRMRGLNVPPDHFESENKVILEERRQRTDNDPRARFAEQMNALSYINHPYAKPVIGWAHEMAALTWPQIKKFYDLWYAPNNAILIVSGDVTGDQVFKLAKKIYGPLKPDPAIKNRSRPSSPPLSGAVQTTLNDPRIREPIVQVQYRVPGGRQDKKTARALEVLNEIMGGGPTSRLYQSLVVTQKIATDAGFHYHGDTWDDGEIGIYAVPVPGHDLKKLKSALDKELTLLADKGVTEDEINAAKTRMIAEAIYAKDSLQGPAMVFGFALTTGQNIDDVEYWRHDIESVTAADIQAVAVKYLNPAAPSPQAPVTGYLMPVKGDSK
jgi:zinc protease